MTLHYFYDPLCGWCYGASPLLQAAALPGLTLEMRAGGMIAPEDGRVITADWRGYVMPHDQRIAQLSGQPFGEAYFNGLLNDVGAPLNSTPPIAAVLAAEALGAPPLAMLAKLQQAHYVDGLRIAEFGTLRERARMLGLDGEAFAAEWRRQLTLAEAHIADTQARMRRHGLRGFPSLLLERDGEWIMVDVSRWLGRPQAFAAELSGLLSEAGTASAADEAAFCTPERCR
nr:DsbA family protein [Chromobacterium sp. ASV5]